MVSTLVRSGLKPETELREFLDQWRAKWGVAADQFKLDCGLEDRGSRSLLADVKAALVRQATEAARPTSREVARALTSLWKLAIQVGLEEGRGAGWLRARWQLLPPNLRAQVVEMTRQRFVRDLQGVADLDRFIATGDPQEVAAAVVSMCSYGARILEKRPSRGTGKRRRTPTPSPILPVSVGKHKGGPIPRRDIDWLIRDLALICLEAMGSTPGRGGAFLDLAENVLQIVGIPGAHDRVREFFDRVEQRPRRLRRRSRFRDEKSAP